MTTITTDSARPAERLGFAALALFTLSPIVLHGLWRPIAKGLRTDGNALGLTFAALAVAAMVLVVHVATWNRNSNKWIPGVIASFAAALFGVLLGQGIAGVGAALVALLGVALFATVLVPWMMSRLPHDLDGLAKRRKGATALVILLGIATITQTARLSTFMGDSTRSELSLIPSVPFLVNHSCLTAYVEATRLTAAGEKNIYDAENWPDLSHSAHSDTLAKRYAPFSLDAFAYPPPFLLLPRLLLAPLADFQAQRALWFALNGTLLAFGLWTVAHWIGGKQQLRPLLLIPLVFISMPVILILQIGNVHAAVLVLAMLAMVAFESDRPVLGGAMLAFAIASKISPGILVVVLLFQRRFREVLWTAGFGVAFVLLGLVVFGTAPFEAFLVYQMPLLSSGKALSFLAQGESIAFNMGPFGIPFKLDFLGMRIGDPWKVAKHINQLFTVGVVILTIFAARKRGTPQSRAAIWLTLLTLGTLRSPYAPGYVTFPLFWLMSLWAIEIRSAKGTILIAAIWLLMGATPPMAVSQLVVLSMLQQSIFIGLLVYSVFREPTHQAHSSTS